MTERYAIYRCIACKGQAGPKTMGISHRDDCQHRLSASVPVEEIAVVPADALDALLEPERRSSGLTLCKVCRAPTRLKEPRGPEAPTQSTDQTPAVPKEGPQPC